MKAACQPKREVTAAIRMGAIKDEALEPELKRPVARARSSEGNHSVVALMAAGKLPDSPRPRKMRAMQKPMTRGDERVAHGGDAPDEDGDSVAGLGAELVDDAAGEEEADAVGDLEADDDAAEVDVVAGWWAASTPGIQPMKVRWSSGSISEKTERSM